MQKQVVGQISSLPKSWSTTTRTNNNNNSSVVGTKPIQGHTFIPITTTSTTTTTSGHNNNWLFNTFYICGGRTHSNPNSTGNTHTRNILSDISKFTLSTIDNNSPNHQQTSSKLVVSRCSDYHPINRKLDAPRHNHTSLYFKSIESVVTFGGSNTEHYFNSIHQMNVPPPDKDDYEDIIDHERSCEIISCENSKVLLWPQTRHGHTANVYKQDEMIVFGGKKGFGTESNLFLNDLWSFNVKTKIWKEIKVSSSSEHHHQPRERCWHSSVIYKDRYLLVCGGFYTMNGDEYYLNDLWSFDLDENVWNCLIEDVGTNNHNGKSNNNNKMKQRNRCGIVLAHNSLYVIFGNYFDGYRDRFLNDIFSVQNLDALLLFNKSPSSSLSNRIGNDHMACGWSKLELKGLDDESRKRSYQCKSAIRK